MLGANEKALESLEQWAASPHEEGVIFATNQLLWAPAFDPIRSDQRFQAIMKSVGPAPATPVQPAP